MRNIVLVAIIDFNRLRFSYVVFKDLRRYNVLIGKCEWAHKTKYKQQIYEKINKKLIQITHQ